MRSNTLFKTEKYKSPNSQTHYTLYTTFSKVFFLLIIPCAIPNMSLTKLESEDITKRQNNIAEYMNICRISGRWGMASAITH